jgi:DNA-binding response OmpR family regulator
MKVLVVDDDRTTRFLLRRALITEFGCAVSEAADGIEALEALGKTRFQLVILDVQMPVMDGLETLRALREADDFKSLPVVMLTVERNEQVVQQVVALGVLDYITKPLVPDRIVERLRRIIRWLNTEADLSAERRGGSQRAVLDPGQSVLVVDGSEDFRHFFVDTLGSRRTVLQAESGARGFRACLESNPSAVFIGSGLGVLNDALLVRKIRSTSAVRDSYLVAIVDKDETPSTRVVGYDAQITRTFVPETFLRQFDALWTSESGALRDLLGLHPGLRVTLISAAEQVFGMMLSTEVTLRQAPANRAGDLVLVQARGAWQEGAGVKCHGCCDVATGRRIAASLLALDPGMLHDEDVDAAVSEVFSMITGRLRNTLIGKEIPIQFDIPSVSHVQEPPGLPADGILLCFHSASKEVEFTIGIAGEPDVVAAPAIAEAGAA